MKIKFNHPIYVGKGELRRLPGLLKKRKVVLIADRKLKVARSKVHQILKRNKIDVQEILVDAGESLKDIQSVYPIYAELMKLKADRDTVILALGGGTVGDVAGFVASTFLRGIEWIGLPTTLLAQVDSSVGGKTGINHEAGKNLIGSFHQPSAVICETDFLKTLSKREMTSGFGEITKTAITFDPKLFQFLVENKSKILAGVEAPLSKCIAKSLQWKCIAVAKDEFDRKGIREVLNFGHTFGHALESATLYQAFQHGEAVVWGMRFAVCLSVVKGKLKSKDQAKLLNFLNQIEVPLFSTWVSEREIFPYMKQDKKSEAGRIRFVLVDRIGHSVSEKRVTRNDLMEAYELMMLEMERGANG